MLYTFYGDDFTGSTDVLEQLASNGVPTALFLGVPTPDHLLQFPKIQAIGIAGDSRSRSPEWMSANLPDIFAILKSFNAPVNHYKVCSTFDSSPTHGSIGRAMEIGREVFHPRFIPIVVGAPHLRRYVAFGNLFAAAPDGQILRIDRHPMSNHPVTPMREADLRRHLNAQTNLPIGLIDLTQLQQSSRAAALEAQLAFGNQAVLFDGIDDQTLAATGELLWLQSQQSPLFAAASSGLTASLIPAWRKSNLIPPSPNATIQHSANAPLLVVSGSCSPVTANQIKSAITHGFNSITVTPEQALDEIQLTKVTGQAITSLNSGQSTILYTSLGPPEGPAEGASLGVSLGKLTRSILRETRTPRVLLCGGDTSSHAIQQLGLYALTWAANIQPGAPLCRAHSDDPELHNLELVLKGGQVGTPDFFSAVQQA